MSLSDLMGHMDLAVWPKMALVLFLAVFVGVIVRVTRGKTSEFDHAAHLPLEGEEARHG